MNYKHTKVTNYSIKLMAVIKFDLSTIPYFYLSDFISESQKISMANKIEKQNVHDILFLLVM